MKKAPSFKPIFPPVENDELAFAGALMLEPDRVLKIARGLGLDVDHFTNDTARRVFGSVSRIVDAGIPCEPSMVQNDTGLDVAVIQKLIDDCPTAAHAEYHANLIRDAALKRDALREIGAADGVEALRMALEKLTAGLPAARAGVQAVDAAEWLTEPDEPEQPILTGLFDAGDRVAIVGQAKARKSFYALQLAVNVATGTQFLGVPTVKQTVLLVNGEIVARAYKRRLRRMIAKMGIESASLDGLTVVNASENADVGGFGEILTLAKKHAVQVVVIDPAYLLLGDEIEQREVKQSIREMKLFAADGVTLVCVYHATKGRMGDKQTIDRISGSGIFARDASTMLTLCEHASEPDHVVIQAITRNHPPSEPMTACFDDGAFVLTDVAPIEKTSMTKTARAIPVEDVADCFTTVKVNYADAVKAVQSRLGVGIGKAKDLIAKAVSAGLVETEKDWRTTFYFNK